MLDSSSDIISEWEKFAQTYVPAAGAMDLKARRDHIEGMLETIAKDLAQPQTRDWFFTG